MEKSAAPKPVKEKNLRAFHSGGFVLVGAYIDFHFHICGLTQVPPPPSLIPQTLYVVFKAPWDEKQLQKAKRTRRPACGRQRSASSNWRVTGAAPESTGKVTHPQTESSSFGSKNSTGSSTAVQIARCRFLLPVARRSGGE